MTSAMATALPEELAAPASPARPGALDVAHKLELVAEGSGCPTGGPRRSPVCQSGRNRVNAGRSDEVL
jgi:hypothetical protein